MADASAYPEPLVIDHMEETGSGGAFDKGRQRTPMTQRRQQGIGRAGNHDIGKLLYYATTARRQGGRWHEGWTAECRT